MGLSSDVVGTFDSDSECMTGCKDCNDASTCNICSDVGFFKTPQNKCQACDPSCFKCNAAGSSSCTECPTSFTLQTDNTCTACNDANCVSCNPTNICSKCQQGFGPSSGICLECAANCVDCSLNSDVCSEC